MDLSCIFVCRFFKQLTSLRNNIHFTSFMTELCSIFTFISPKFIYLLCLQDLQTCIEEDFPLGTELTPLEREREAHQAFADARCQVYIGREDYFTQINAELDKDINQPMVLLGESGTIVKKRKQRIVKKHKQRIVKKRKLRILTKT